MSRSAAVMVVLVLCLVSSVAMADNLTSTRGQSVEELEHTVTVRVDDGVARYRVLRRFVNHGERPEEMALSVSLPPGAAANGLRIAAGGQWYEGRLLAAERAERIYEQLTGIGRAPLQDPALLRWEGEEEVELRVFPLLSERVSTVEYTLTAPVRYEGGRWIVRYPVAVEGSGLLPPSVTLVGTSGLLAGEPIAADEARPLGGGLDGQAELLVDASPEVVACRYGVADVAPDKAFARLWLDVAPKLSSAPEDLRVVFVVDASRSLGAEGIDAQVALIEAWLQRAPGARVEVVVFRREAEVVIGGFVPASEVPQRLREAVASGSLGLGNGSHLDAGLSLAASRLERVAGTPRIIAMTDSKLRHGFKTDTVLDGVAGLKGDAVLHIALPSKDGKPSVDRFDGHTLAPLTVAHGGVVAGVRGASDGGDPTLIDAVEYLVRPTRLDDVQLVLRGASSSLGVPDILREGEGFEAFVQLDASPARRGVLRGRLWTTPWEGEVRATRPLGTLTAATVFAEGLDGGLTDPERMKVAQLGHVVSPVTSFLAIEPGTRPSREGIVRYERATGLLGAGMGYAGTRCSGYGVHSTFNPRSWLRDGVQDCFSTGRTVERGRLRLETTGSEIVDVEVSEVSDASLGACLREAAWKVQLPDEGPLGHNDMWFSLAELQGH